VIGQLENIYTALPVPRSSIHTMKVGRLHNCVSALSLGFRHMAIADKLHTHAAVQMSLSGLLHYSITEATEATISVC
jgi:hypothetical protein